MGRECYERDFFFLDTQLGHLTTKLTKAVLWSEVYKHEVQIVWKGRHIGKLNFVGIVKEIDENSDLGSNYGDVLYAENEDFLYINIPDEEGMLEKFPLAQAYC